jgi:DnaK suppressor protein
VAVKKTAKKAVKAAKKVAKPAVAKSVAKRPWPGKQRHRQEGGKEGRSGNNRQACQGRQACRDQAGEGGPKPVAKPAAVKKMLPAKPASRRQAQGRTGQDVGGEGGPGKIRQGCSSGRGSQARCPVAPPKSHHKHEKSVPATKKNTAKDVNKSSPPAKPVPVKTTGKVAVAVVARAPAAPSAPNKRKVVEYATDPTSGRPVLPKGYKPAADEEYMSPLQLEYFRQRLLKWRADLIEESKQTIENLRTKCATSATRPSVLPAKPRTRWSCVPATVTAS